MKDIAEINKKIKKDSEDFKRGYDDYMREYEKSAYQRGRDEAKRVLEQREELSKLIRSGLKEYY